MRPHQLLAELPRLERPARDRITVREDQRRMGVRDISPRPHKIIGAAQLPHVRTEHLADRAILRPPAFRDPAVPDEAEVNGRTKRPLVAAHLRAADDLDVCLVHKRISTALASPSTFHEMWTGMRT